MIEREIDILVIGAGLTGLTTSFYLKKHNKQFITLDCKDEIGGVIGTKEENGFIYETGPNTGVIGNTTVVEIFDELAGDCELETGGENVKKRYILKDGKWEALPSGLSSAIKTPLFTFKDKLRLLGEPFRKPGNNPHETLSDFVKRRLGNSFLQYAIDPFILGVYAGDPNYLIPKYALPKLYNLEQNYGSLIKGTFKKGFEKKTEMEKRVSRKVFSCKNGLSSLTNGLYKRAGIENFQFGLKNIKVDKVEWHYITNFTDANGQENRIKSHKVISTIGAYALEDTFTFIDQRTMNNISSLLYTQVIEVSIGFNKWDGIELDGFGGLIPSSEKRDILGVLYMSALFPNRAPKDGALITVFIGGVRRQDLISLNDDEIYALVERECSDLMKLSHFAPNLFKIVRHSKAIPQYGVESGLRFDTIDGLERKHEGLILAGNMRNGIGMADRMQQGKDLAMKVI